MNNVDDEYTNLQQKYYDIQQKYNDMTNKIKCINEAKRKFDHLH
jgi:peptidoglycan hydrolase CwlO-like protein